MSSHREAPEIAKDPAADSTDVYAFVSPDQPATVTLIALVWIRANSNSNNPSPSHSSSQHRSNNPQPHQYLVALRLGE